MNQHSSLTNHFRSWFDWCFCNRFPVQVLQQIRKKWESRGTHRVYRARVNFLSLTEDSVFQWGMGLIYCPELPRRKTWGSEGLNTYWSSTPVIVKVTKASGVLATKSSLSAIIADARANFLSGLQNACQQPLLQFREGQEAAKSLPYIWN